MNRRIKRTFKNARAWLHIKSEQLFPATIETRLIQVLGGSTLTIGAFRRNGRQLTFVLSRGRLLRSERFRRAVLDDQGVLANDVKFAIALQGADYERDVIKAYEHDERLKQQGWIVRYIPERWLWENPMKVKQAVGEFIYQ